jgi:hypothetical protein
MTAPQASRPGAPGQTAFAFALAFATATACGSAQGSPTTSDAGSRPATGDDAGVTTQFPPGTCENGSLSFGPYTLVSTFVGAAYSVDLRDYASSEWSGVEYSADDLPPGISLASVDEPRLTGKATKSGQFTFTVAALHGVSSNGCSTMPDPASFVLDVGGDATAVDAGADASSESDGSDADVGD